jgi:hypothetical protein
MLRSVFIISVVLLFGWLFGMVLLRQIGESTEPMANKIAKALYPDDWMNITIGNTTVLWSKKPDSPGVVFSINLSNFLYGLASCLFPISAGMNAPVLIINK